MEAVEYINAQIILNKKSDTFDSNLISDSYHTFGELYNHRTELFITLCRIMAKIDNGVVNNDIIWKQRPKDGWFLMGIKTKHGEQISYHIPESNWGYTNFAFILKEEEYAFDGHTSADVLERLKQL